MEEIWRRPNKKENKRQRKQILEYKRIGINQGVIRIKRNRK